MAFDEVKENISEAEATARSYLDSSRQFYKLKGFKLLMKGVMFFVKIVSVGIMLILSLLFLSISAAFWIGSLLEHPYQGFLIVGGCYLLFGLLIFLFRHSLRKPLLKKFSEFYFDEI
ncbi:hypothetical protein LCGC14_1607920 [marine sediment metagenome]|uniref:Holin-X, holin superfamily III n=2 Tax=root TaxID=1 RepID=A0A831VMN0_9FLAO|nr:hypothetical protein [Pricia antarctica]